MLNKYVLLIYLIKLSFSIYGINYNDKVYKSDTEFPLVNQDQIIEHVIHTYVVPGQFNKWITLSPNQTSEFVIQYSYLAKELKSQTLRVEVTCYECFISHPILVVVKQQKEVFSWELPLVSYINEKQTNYYDEVSRMLCPINHANKFIPFDKKQRLFLEFSTSYNYNVTFHARVNIVEDFMISLNEQKTFNVEPSKPRYYFFQFPDNVNVVLAKVTSLQNICAVMSVQNVSCPVFYLESNYRFANMYQTMTLQAGITAKKEDFPNGFYIVVLVLPSDSKCLQHSQGTDKRRIKNVTVSVEESINGLETLAAVFAGIGFCMFFYIITLVIGCIAYMRGISTARNLAPLPDDVTISITNSDLSNSEDSATILHSRLNSQRLDAGISNSTNDRAASLSSSSCDEMDYDLLEDIDNERDIFRMKTALYVSDLARKDTKILRRNSNLYILGLFTVSIFYAVPVIQLVFTYQNVLDESGNQDICYYNFWCAHRFGMLNDFNHVFSNIGYILFALLFIGVTARRDKWHRKLSSLDRDVDKKIGIPQHFGLYYSMGGALLVEGLLSGCYHICPSSSNFQFDTTFMYVIAVVCMLKIYQTRHPDVNAGAAISYFVLAVVVLFGVIGVLDGSVYFWVIFIIIHVVMCIFVSLQIYYIGRYRIDKNTLRQVATWFQHERHHLRYLFKPVYCDRMVLLLIGNAANWGFSIYAIFWTINNFASFLVIIFVSNLLLYTAFYIIMKLRHGESILIQPIINLILCIISWMASAYFFLNPSISWSKLPAESREINKDCILLGFYDNHDIWHFLSASAMFFGFMLLLTLDDDLVYTQRDKIAVF